MLDSPSGVNTGPIKRDKYWLCLCAVCLLSHPRPPPRGKGDKRRQAGFFLASVFRRDVGEQLFEFGEAVREVGAVGVVDGDGGVAVQAVAVRFGLQACE